MKATQLLHELGQSLSLEVSPTLAHDTAGTLAAARDLFARAGRPNQLIKIPGTKEGPRYRRMKEAL